ncbi:M20 family metallo-hydrolase [Kyrpidia spormannii]|uniref:Zn-dependent hydrolase n=2 Tax=Kyrpidia spormannii TaxID=2055160 RepID=A0ACA8ZCT1_9BACL|nr:M20 family metallo-hydrolase [Kyrpidia spormannii]CAB3394746.1 Zn-dependent hydrolase [Kyrpidia spormannii]CAB3395713.1 Zn-dependent hydrolase [Kyrpidia spormannii]
MKIQLKEYLVRSERFLASVRDLASIGATAGGGVHRLALSPDDIRARKQMVEWMEEAGLTVSVDDMGNLYGLRPGRNPGPPILFGSHVDTVPFGGRFDGAYGVLAGLEVMRVLHEHRVETEHPLGLAIFTNEEGARFQPAMMGSSVAVGKWPVEEAYAVRDQEGIAFGDALQASGFLGERRNRISRPLCYVELHIEQGPVLEAAGKTIGIVQGIVAQSWHEVVLEGEANHAGTTPPSRRRDPLVAAARWIAYVHEMAESSEGALLVTCGRIAAEPGAVNVIPRKVAFTVDLRSADEVRLRKAEEQMFAWGDDLCRRAGVEKAVRRLHWAPYTPFASGIRELIRESCLRRGYTFLEMPSGAGHDAQHLAGVCETGMIFVPSREGKSHCEEEFSADGDLVKGAQVLLDTVLGLDRTR